MTIDHCFLNAVQFSLAGQAFDRDDVATIELENELDAGVDRKVTSAFIIGSIAKDRTGAAVAFGADDFGAGEFEASSKEGGERQKCVGTSDLVLLTVYNE